MMLFVRIKYALWFLKNGFTEIYRNFFYGSGGRGRPKAAFTFFAAISLAAYTGTQCYFGAKTIFAGTIIAGWMPWVLAGFGFVIWTVLMPACVYILDYNSQQKSRSKDWL